MTNKPRGTGVWSGLRERKGGGQGKKGRKQRIFRRREPFGLSTARLGQFHRRQDHRNDLMDLDGWRPLPLPTPPPVLWLNLIGSTSSGSLGFSRHPFDWFVRDLYHTVSLKRKFLLFFFCSLQNLASMSPSSPSLPMRLYAALQTDTDP